MSGKKLLPEYKSFLSFSDMREIANYCAVNRTEVRYQDGAVASNTSVSDFDVALFTLERGLKELGGVKITKDNFEEELRKQCGVDEIILLYFDLWARESKKK